MCDLMLQHVQGLHAHVAGGERKEFITPILVRVPQLKNTRELICYDYPENMLLQPNISNLFSFSHNLKETAHLNS